MTERKNLPAATAAQDVAVSTAQRGSLVGRGLAAVRNAKLLTLMNDDLALYRQAANTSKGDLVDNLFIASTYDYMLCFSNSGRVHWIKLNEVLLGSQFSRAKLIVNQLQLIEGDKIIAILPVNEFDEGHFIFMATASGIVKKAPLTDFSRPVNPVKRGIPISLDELMRGIIAINLDEDDFLIGAAITDGRRDIMLFSDDGKAVRFEEGDVRVTGRKSRGVIGMRLRDGQKVISLLVGEDDDEIVLITNTDRMVRTSVKEIRGMGRATQGVTLIHLSENEKLSGLDKLMKPIVRE